MVMLEFHPVFWLAEAILIRPSASRSAISAMGGPLLRDAESVVLKQKETSRLGTISPVMRPPMKRTEPSIAKYSNSKERGWIRKSRKTIRTMIAWPVSFDPAKWGPNCCARRTKWRLRRMIRNNAASNNCARPPQVAERKTVSWEPGLCCRLILAGQNESKKSRNMLCMRCWREITSGQEPGQQNWLQPPNRSSTPYLFISVARWG